MWIEEIKVYRYRAFDKAAVAKIRGLTVLTGGNNLGKTTLIRALDLFFNEVSRYTYSGFSGATSRRSISYDYDRDYPAKYKGQPGRRYATRISLRLTLTPDESKEAFGVEDPSISTSCVIELDFRKNKQGRHVAHFSHDLSEENGQKIIQWLRDSVSFVHIPAARLGDGRNRAFYEPILIEAVGRVRQSKRRLAALERLQDDISKELATIEQDITEAFREYLPDIESVKFNVRTPPLQRIFSISGTIINDGSETDLSDKGDGLKSLFYLSLLRYFASQDTRQTKVFAIEEPEAHLHSSAIYDVKESLERLSDSAQVIISTHSPVLVDQTTLSANLIVERSEEDSRASTIRVAKDRQDIRTALGVLTHENLVSADVFLVVEGQSEEKVLASLLARSEPRLAPYFKEGRVQVISADSATKVRALIRGLGTNVAHCVVLLDSDAAGLQAAKELRDARLVDAKDIIQIPLSSDARESEFEDAFGLWASSATIEKILSTNVNEHEIARVRNSTGGKKKKIGKWSDYMSLIVAQHGGSWEVLEEQMKATFASILKSRLDDIDFDSMQWLSRVGGRLLAATEHR